MPAFLPDFMSEITQDVAPPGRNAGVVANKVLPCPSKPALQPAGLLSCRTGPARGGDGLAVAEGNPANKSCDDACYEPL